MQNDQNPNSENWQQETTREKKREKKNLLRFFESPLFWIAFVFVAFGLPLGRSFFLPQVKSPRILGQLPAFQLTNQDNKVVGLNNFRGTVLVVNFIFTSCPDVCPLLTQQMAKIQSRLMGVGPAIRLVSISVDPTTDTPAVLKAYGEKYHADFKTWQFLTGSLDSVHKVVVDGFKIAMDGKADPNLSLFDITHGEHFVIVDQLGRIRAYMQASNSDQIGNIIKTVAILANSNPNQTALTR